MISIPRSRSAFILRTIANCWKSLRPKQATAGRVAANNFVTTVATPRK
jgi:hypothetical protein